MPTQAFRGGLVEAFAMAKTLVFSVFDARYSFYLALFSSYACHLGWSFPSRVWKDWLCVDEFCEVGNEFVHLYGDGWCWMNLELGS